MIENRPIETIVCSYLNGRLYVSPYKWNDPSYAFREWDKRVEKYMALPHRLRLPHPDPAYDTYGWLKDAFRLKVDEDEAELDAGFDGWRHLQHAEVMQKEEK